MEATGCPSVSFIPGMVPLPLLAWTCTFTIELPLLISYGPLPHPAPDEKFSLLMTGQWWPGHFVRHDNIWDCTEQEILSSGQSVLTIAEVYLDYKHDMG